MALRNLFYDKGWIRSTQFTIPVVVVGNLNTGGTGKTPAVELLVRLLKNKHKIATLSRGYGRKTSGYLEAAETSTARDTGDEPLQFKKKFPGITVSVCEDRVTGLKRILEDHPGTNAVILDDAFQHRRVKAGLNILLTAWNDPFYNDHVLPAGNLREFTSGKKRADIIIFAKCPRNISDAEKREAIESVSPRPGQEIFFSYLRYGILTECFGTGQIQPSKDTSVLLVTGIAQAAPLAGFVSTLFGKMEHLDFDDHHIYETGDFEAIRLNYQNLPGKKKIILTTEKDAMRFEKEDLDGLPFYYIPIEAAIMEEERFKARINKFVDGY
jgi:tetraacyldisaccharide 4'-kinase